VTESLTVYKMMMRVRVEESVKVTAFKALYHPDLRPLPIHRLNLKLLNSI